MHSSRRAVVTMSLLQNYILRSSIDRALFIPASLTIGTATSSSSISIGSARFLCHQNGNISTTISVSNGAGPSNNKSSNISGISVEPSLDEESLNKLNELKQGLQSKNEYFEKYKEKFSKLQTASPRELLAKLEQLDDQKRDQLQRLQKAEKIGKKPRTLNDVMHMDSLKNLERLDIINLWQEFHRHKEGLLGAVMSGVIYDKMKDLASVHKTFVMPLPRTDGYEFFLLQFEDNTFHFTPLILYQTHKESAPVALKLINYTDLKKDKDLILLRGEYDHKSMNAEDAHFLAVQTNFYYGETNESRLALLNKFTTKPDDFNHTDLIDELKSIQATHAQLFEFEPANKGELQ